MPPVPLFRNLTRPPRLSSGRAARADSQARYTAARRLSRYPTLCCSVDGRQEKIYAAGRSTSWIAPFPPDWRMRRRPRQPSTIPPPASRACRDALPDGAAHRSLPCSPGLSARSPRRPPTRYCPRSLICRRPPELLLSFLSVAPASSLRPPSRSAPPARYRSRRSPVLLLQRDAPVAPRDYPRASCLASSARA